MAKQKPTTTTTTTDTLPPHAGTLQDPIEIRATDPVPSVVLPPDDGDYSEEGRWRRSLLVRNAQTTPPTWPRYPEGTYAFNYASVRDAGCTEEWYQLQRFALDDPRIAWLEIKPDASDAEIKYHGRWYTVERYVQWIRDGHQPPPLTGYEMKSGRINIVDGHHRGLALYRTGCREVWIWVSLLGNPEYTERGQ